MFWVLLGVSLVMLSNIYVEHGLLLCKGVILIVFFFFLNMFERFHENKVLSPVVGLGWDAITLI